MREATVCHLRQGINGHTRILLGKRVSLFCNGIWNGPGGKMEPNETIANCAYREVKEEIAVKLDIKSLHHYATADFYHPQPTGHILEWKVPFLWVDRWKLEPKLVNGFSDLQWFSVTSLPFDKMMTDQRIWLPHVINNSYDHKIAAVQIYYGNSKLESVVDHSIKFIDRPIRH
ncbi:TPA: hypothetical protein DCQ44_00615 [Candidatus Taylorbacteria bacterium]|nr:hypothetical protein [Candidatus Taylorbacteria bacterium]